MIELIKAKLEVLIIEIETVSLLGHSVPKDSSRSLAVWERHIELKKEISRLHANLSHAQSAEANDAAIGTERIGGTKNRRSARTGTLNNE
jgi:hypothetical protein